jgi:hypothetical protein
LGKHALSDRIFFFKNIWDRWRRIISLHPQFGAGVWETRDSARNREPKRKFIDRMDRAHNLDLRKIEMMKLGKKSEAFSLC